MYIAPGTNIRLLKNVPLDTTYDHTIYFQTVSAQTAYFMGLTKYNLTGYTYQRVNSSVIKIGISADLIYDCNYMMFQNTNFGNKWFYAYIKSVDYVNNGTSEITYEIDDMQTWYFDYELDDCFVEREHVTNDDIGDHIEPESVDLGEYVYNNNHYVPILDLTEMCAIISVVDTNQPVSGTIYDGVYSGATLWVYDVTDIDGINAKINEYVQSPDSILSIYTCPLNTVGLIPGTHFLASRTQSNFTDINIDAVSTASNLDGYLPRNGKMYTYPYNFYLIDNAAGETMSIRYEFCRDLQPKLRLQGSVTQPVELVLRPYDYKGNGERTLNTESLTLRNYPLCAWTVDSFQAWIAQNSIPAVMDTAKSVGMGFIGGGPGGAGMGALYSISNLMGQGYQASIRADIAKGSVSGNPNVSAKKQQFYGGRCSVSFQYAKIIDQYFTKFGYAVRQLKKPNIGTRPHWNYVKTIGCTAKGSVPADSMRNICRIYDNGITFWINGSEVGDYSLNNSILDGR